MKANRASRQAEDSAVSPVIAVILMVAITVVLAATVYVWVSGFGSQSSNPAKTMSLTSNGALNAGYKNYTVASATAGMRYSDITITVNGASLNQSHEATDGSYLCPTVPATPATQWVACRGTLNMHSNATVTAGDAIRLGSLTAGQSLRVVDSQANSVILTLTIG